MDTPSERTRFYGSMSSQDDGISMQLPLPEHEAATSTTILYDDRHAAPSTADDSKLIPPGQPNTYKLEEVAMETEHRVDNGGGMELDPGIEDVEVQDNKFAFSPGQLSRLLKSLPAFQAAGGLTGLERGLRTDRRRGLNSNETVFEDYVSFHAATANAGTSKAPLGQVTAAKKSHSMPRTSHESFADRRRIFKDNHLPIKKTKSLLQLMWMTFNDQVLILLSVAAIISLAIGLYQTFGTVHTPQNPPLEWIEGVAIIVAIVVIVIVGSVNDYEKEQQFAKLYQSQQDRDVKVIRSGHAQEISIFDVLVGDVVYIEPGDVIPADGIFIDGYNVRCDESSLTGESSLSSKDPADEVFQEIEDRGGGDLPNMDPFVISGAKVVEGIGTFLVIGTGLNSSHGKTLSSLNQDPEATPLQSRLNTLAERIAKVGGAAALLLFLVLFIEFLVRLRYSTETPPQKGQDFVNIIIITLTVVVIAIPEGLPLAVTLALAFATTRMLKDHNLVRRLQSCETMGNVTYICSDKTGTLTENKMVVVEGIVGAGAEFMDKAWPSPLARDVQRFTAAIDCVNSTAFESNNDGQQTYIGSTTEVALLTFARDQLEMGTPVSEERSRANIVQLIPFDSSRKYMGTVVKLQPDKYRLYVKGAPEILLPKCSSIVCDPEGGTAGQPIKVDNTEYLDQTITKYASKSWRTIGLFFRDFEQWPHRIREERSEDDHQDILANLTFLGIFGIRDPLRDNVQEAVKACQDAGVVVCMVSGDNHWTAKSIAEECGILSPQNDEVAMDAKEFRNLTPSQLHDIFPRLRVITRSTPLDKQLLVTRLKDLGNVVAVTGDGTNDALALKTADIGFSMGISGTEVAKEASDIILTDDNFSSIVKAIMWGRAINDSVRRFLQFQVTVSVTTVGLTFVSAVFASNEQSVLTAVQLMWVNLIQDTMAALALATDAPMPNILDRKPDPRTAPLLTINMWKMIVGQSIYQLAVTLVLHFRGVQIFSYQSAHEQAQLQTLVFNTFVWMQIFNLANNRRLDNKLNIFEGVSRNKFFIGIFLTMVGVQVLIAFIGGKAFSITRMNTSQWLWSVGLGAFSMPVGSIIRLIPNKLFMINGLRIFNRQKVSTTPDTEQQFQFPKPLEDIREELAFLKKIRGGRLNNLKFALRSSRLPWSSGNASRAKKEPAAPGITTTENVDNSQSGLLTPTPKSQPRSRRNSRPRAHSALGPAAAAAGIIAGSIAGWSVRRDGEALEDPREQSSSSQLETGTGTGTGTDDIEMLGNANTLLKRGESVAGTTEIGRERGDG
ncbi:hypothetical protein G7Y89_g11402 [Cudoniella acicularis]|uniref:Calcium-transporting ATPase n=1 Tax=Cudoniella acicularis TaxID=354080 RepID=A0A8H4VY22_9HELO|nr:hypothetical protein G7Y89_g11402 [Cudoniella acicularis]